ncbi:hypothetical protein D3C85_716380 [compost metagenome]
MLVTPRELVNRLQNVRAANAQTRLEIDRHRALGQFIHHPAFGHGGQVGHAGIAGDAFTQYQAGALAVFGGVGQTVIDGLAHGAKVDVTPFQARLAADVRAIGAAKYTHGEFGTPSAHQPGNAHHLAPTHMEIDVADAVASGVRRVADRPALDLEQRFANVRNTLRIAVRQFAADHGADHPAFIDRLGTTVDDIDGTAITDHGDLVRHPSNLIELVRDDDRGDATPFELEHQLEQCVAVLFVEARGRLVKNQQAYVLGQGLGDLHHLLLADTEVTHQGLRPGIEADPRE